jgi:hypothetical protein
MRCLVGHVVLFFGILAMLLGACLIFASDTAATWSYIVDWLQVAALWLLPRVLMGVLIASWTVSRLTSEKRGRLVSMAAIAGAGVGIAWDIWIFHGMEVDRWIPDAPLIFFLSFVIFGVTAWCRPATTCRGYRLACFVMFFGAVSFALAVSFPPRSIYGLFVPQEGVRTTWILYANPRLEVSSEIGRGEVIIECIPRLVLLCPGWSDSDRQARSAYREIPGTATPTTGLDTWLVSAAERYARVHNRLLQRYLRSHGTS